MDAREQPPFAPLALRGRRVRERAAHRKALRLQRGERRLDARGRHGKLRGECGGGRRPQTLEPPAHRLDERGFAAHGLRATRGRRHRGLRTRRGEECGKERQPLGGDPDSGARANDVRHAPLRGELGDQVGPARAARDLGIGEVREPQQRIVQLVGIRRIRPGLLAHAADGLGIELAQVRGALRIEPAPAHHRLGASLLERRVIEIGVRSRREHLERERGGLGEIAGQHLDAARFKSAQQPLESAGVHCLLEAVPQRLAHQRVIGNLELARQILRAGELVREDGGEQILRGHARERRRHFLPAAKARQGERDRRAPAPAHRKHGRGAHGLHEDRACGVGMQVTRHVGELEAVRRRERQHDRVLGGRRLQLEVEGAAEAFAQREPPGAVDAAAEGGVNDELHAAGFVEEALEDESLLGRERAERGAPRGEIVDELLRGGGGHARGGREPRARRLEPSIELRLELAAQPRDARRQLIGAPGRLAEPEGDRRRLTARVLDPDAALLDAQNAVRHVAELEDIALQALDREVLVHRADELRLGLENHLVVGVVRNGAPGGERGESRPAPPLHPVVHAVVMDERAVPAAARAVALREHAHDLVELGALEVAAGIRPAQQVVEPRLVPLARRHFGDDLLREDVERLRGHRHPVEFPASHRREERRALDQVIARQRKQSSLRSAAHRVTGAADALQECRDRARRAELTDEVHLADVDPELEGCGGDERAQLAALQPALCREAGFLRHAAVVGGDVLLAEPLGEMPRDALGLPPGVDEHERRPVLAHELRQAVVDLRPHLPRHHRLER